MGAQAPFFMQDPLRTYYSKLLQIKNSTDFDTLMHSALQYQLQHNRLYNDYHCLLQPNKPLRDENPYPAFLPVSLFKTHRVLTGKSEPEIVFRSSGTTGQISQHAVIDASWYREVSMAAFEYFYGNVSEYAILALLPGYVERGNASLVYMVNHFIQLSAKPESGYYMNNHMVLRSAVETLECNKQAYLLFGVSSALLRFAGEFPVQIKNGIVMETGGTKAMETEILKEDLHNRLRMAFGVEQVHSEYGMTELLSQAYSQANGVFRCPPWMKVLVRDPNDPFLISNSGSGAINIIDLANIHSCCFIETSDLGRVYPDGSFEILGRFDHSDVRGCNQMG